MKEISFILLILFSFCVQASGSKALPYQIDVDLTDQKSLQRGFTAFVENCLGCHSTQYQRYNRIGQDLGISLQKMKSQFIHTGTKVGEHVMSAMLPKESAQWFGVAPPDLTLVARVRGASWIYSYLKSFYVDPSRPFGVNNTVFPTVAMPHVLEKLQGTPIAQRDAQGHITNIEASGGQYTPEEYDQFVKDITSFLTYSAEPVQVERKRIGVWVLVFLAVFSILGWFLKREYWKDVH
tara:strand:+ start:1473 stop:2183 length:711 start_codon:yes stop_codon:yes gene_type:complete